MPQLPPGYPVLQTPSIPPPPPSTSPVVSQSMGDPQWGLYLNGQLALTADSVASFSYKQDWSLLDYPIEKGAFEDYNKVQTPFDVRFRFTKGGSPEDRKSFLDTVKTITSDLNFYAAYTPEEFYASVNIHHYDYTRTSRNGAGLLVVDIWAEEVRVTAESSTTGSSPVVAPKSPASATPQNNGLVNSQDNSSNTILMNQAQKNALSEELFSGQPGS